MKNINTETRAEIYGLIYDIKKIRRVMRHSQPNQVWDSLQQSWTLASRHAFDLCDKLPENDKQEFKKKIYNSYNVPVGNQY